VIRTAIGAGSEAVAVLHTLVNAANTVSAQTRATFACGDFPKRTATSGREEHGSTSPASARHGYSNASIVNRSPLARAARASLRVAWPSHRAVAAGFRARRPRTTDVVPRGVRRRSTRAARAIGDEQQVWYAPQALAGLRPGHTRARAPRFGRPRNTLDLNSTVD